MPGHTPWSEIPRTKEATPFVGNTTGQDHLWSAGHSLFCLRLTPWWKLNERFYWWRLARKDTKRAIAYYYDRRRNG